MICKTCENIEDLPCRGCRAEIEREFSTAKTRNCLYYPCAGRANCSRTNLIKYCVYIARKSQPDRLNEMAPKGDAPVKTPQQCDEDLPKSNPAKMAV